MSSPLIRQPLIARYYHVFLDSGNAADFVASVSSMYTLATLHRLIVDGDRIARRSAVLSVTLIGRSASIPFVGRALRDPDRAVRLIAEDGIQSLWYRAGTFQQVQQLQMVMRLNAAGRHSDAMQLTDQILTQNSSFGEAWYQRAEALLSDGHCFEAIADCQRALECEPYHFPAAFSMSQGYLEMGDLSMAIECLRRTLEIHPHFEFARAQIQRLEREQREQTDR